MAKEKNKTELPQVMEGELQARLIKLREDAGYDVSQMAAVLCLSEEVIVNLENEAFELLPEPPYVRGYLRNYAKLSDEDSSELITRYEALRGADADELDYQIKPPTTLSSKSNKSISPIWAQVIMLAILLGGLSLLWTIPAVQTWVTAKWGSLSSQLDHSAAENNPSLIGDLPVPVPLPEDELSTAQQINTAANSQIPATTNTETQTAGTVGETANIENSGNIPNTETTTASATETNATTEAGSQTTATTEAINETTVNSETATNNDTLTETTPENTTATTTNQETSTDTTQEVISSDPSGLINIKLVFNNEVWLRIKDKENKTVFEGLNKEGTEKTVDLQKPLTFRVGNAQGLSLFIDNKAVDISSYINGSIANFTLE